MKDIWESNTFVESVAKIAHEANRGYCQALGDNSQLPWDQAPDWQKSSIRQGVLYLLSHPDSTPEDSHKSWLALKVSDGWKWGPVKDVEKKEHPCVVPYAELPVEQKAKDYIFRAIVHAAWQTFG